MRQEPAKLAPAVLHGLHEGADQVVRSGDDVLRTGEAALADVRNELLEAGHPLHLHFLLRLVEVTILFRVPGIGRGIVAKDVFGEQELDVAAAARASSGVVAT